MAVGRAVSPHLGLESPAWDVWLLYDRNATWGEDPMPAPAWWEHQLQSLPPDRRLAPERYAREAARLLQSNSEAGGTRGRSDSGTHQE